MTLANLTFYYTWKNKTEYNNNKFKSLALTWNDTFDLPYGSYSILDIQHYFEFIIKKHKTLVENPPVQIYVNKILELLTPETMKLLESNKKKKRKVINYQNQNPKDKNISK